MKKTRFFSVVLMLVMLVGFVSFAKFDAYAADYSTVRYGSSGEDVKTLQKMLNLVDNAGLTVDGQFGRGTQAAVKNYQSDKGLTADGVVGPATWKVLSAEYAIKNSKLAIGSGRYAPGTLIVGNTYSISGKITSNYTITSVTVGVYKADGTATAQVKTVKPNALSYDISAVDSSIKFGSLGTGSYKFKVVATDASGNSKTLVNNSFSVNPKSTLAIAAGKFAPGTLVAGNTYAINGKITSNYTITSVTVGIYKADGTATAQVKTVAPNATSYDISGVDSSIKFGTLAAGTYSFKVTAKDASGMSKTLVNNSFVVKPQSTLAIAAGRYAPGTLTVGDVYSIGGEISSNYKITSVTVGIYYADGTATSQVKTVAPDATSYDISGVDSGIKFGALAEGTYYFKVTATDELGVTKTLVNNSFNVTPKSTLAIGSGKYAPGAITVGGTYSISGNITSNFEITSVTVGIYKMNGDATAQVKTVNPNATSYDISEVDKYIKFGALTVDTYYFKVIATDAAGVTKTLVNKQFVVEGSIEQTIRANALANWVAPVRTSYLTVPGTGRAFGAYRSSTRSHAGIDFYVRNGHGTPVYAMESGIVIEYVAYFYAGTSSVAIKHADGTILRYCEISTSLRVGDEVRRGDKIGKIIANTKDGGTMLHLELYAGTASGALTNRTNTTYDFASGTKYNRRRDLMNPEFLTNIKRT